MHCTRKYSRCKLGCWNRRSCLWSCRQFIPFSITIRSLFLRSNTFQSLTLLLAPQMQTLSIVFHPIQLSCNCYFNRHWRTKIAHSIEMVVQWSPFTFVCTSVLGSPQCCSSYLKSYILHPPLGLAIQWHCYNPICQHHYAYSQVNGQWWAWTVTKLYTSVYLCHRCSPSTLAQKCSMVCPYFYKSFSHRLLVPWV